MVDDDTAGDLALAARELAAWRRAVAELFGLPAAAVAAHLLQLPGGRRLSLR